jgi:hypothetical protein
MKYIPLNWRIMQHPVNWIIVVLMVLIAGFALDIINRWWAQHNAQNGDVTA